MPRTREFDPKVVLEDAMRLFWEKGYAATSVEDLVARTGVNRFGLYDVYGSKHGLYLAALESYYHSVVSAAIAEIEEPGAGLDAIEAVFDRLLKGVRSGHAKNGCLLCNAAEEVAPFDPEVAEAVGSFQRRLVKGFTAAVRVAQERGEVSTTQKCEDLGCFLAGLIQGASFLARSPASATTVSRFVRVGLRVLR